MSSGFVSAGTNEVPVERDDEWLKAQNDIEENRRRRAEESRQQGGKSLYETLQANKGVHLGSLRSLFNCKLKVNMPAVSFGDCQPPNRKHSRSRFG